MCSSDLSRHNACTSNFAGKAAAGDFNFWQFRHTLSFRQTTSFKTARLIHQALLQQPGPDQLSPLSPSSIGLAKALALLCEAVFEPIVCTAFRNAWRSFLSLPNSECITLPRPARLPLFIRTFARRPLALGVACLASTLLISPAQANTASTQAARDIGAPTTLPNSTSTGKRVHSSSNSSDLRAVLKQSTGLYHALLGYL